MTKRRNNTLFRGAKAEQTFYSSAEEMLQILWVSKNDKMILKISLFESELVCLLIGYVAI